MRAATRAFKTGRLRRRSQRCEREQMLLATTPSASIPTSTSNGLTTATTVDGSAADCSMTCRGGEGGGAAGGCGEGDGGCDGG